MNLVGMHKVTPVITGKNSVSIIHSWFLKSRLKLANTPRLSRVQLHSTCDYDNATGSEKLINK